MRRRELAHEQPAAPPREGEPGSGAGAGEHQALGQQLAREPQPRGAERQPHAQLVRRAVARASSRLAMLAQAISSTSADDDHECAVSGCW